MQLENADNSQLSSITSILADSLTEASLNPEVTSDFVVPDQDSLKAVSASNPTIVTIREELIEQEENQTQSSTFEIVVKQPLTFEVACSELDCSSQENIKQWADAKLRRMLKDFTLRLGLNQNKYVL